MNGFIPGLTLVSTGTHRVDYIESAEASDMEAKFTAYIAALDVEGGLNVEDITLAAAGDGHTFILAITVSSATNATTDWLEADLDIVRGRFWMGATAEALAEYQEAAIASLLAGSLTRTIANVATGFAGSSKGQRFMAFLAGQFTSA